jgi:protein-disulfide isomerase
MQLFASALLLAALVISAPAAQTKSTRATGPVTAAVRIDLFSDFQCPACKALHEQTIKRVKEEFAMKGKLRLVHHDFPLPQHKYARQAAILAAAADRLGKYDDVADALFRQQESWSQSGNVDAVVDGVLTPEERKKLREIAKDPAILAGIERDVQLGTRMMVSSTPTMIVTHDGKPNPVVGVVSYAVFSKFLNTIVGP